MIGRVGAVFLLSIVAAVPTAQSAVDSPRSLILTQARLFKQGRFRVMYVTTYTPNFRMRCPWPTYLRGQTALKRHLGSRFSLRHVRVQMLSARRALVAYQFVRANGQLLGSVTFRDGDLYVKVGGRWYDEYDRVSVCP